MNDITRSQSLILYYLKAFAVFSIVSAHVAVVPSYFSYSSLIACNLLKEIGAIGVGVFFAVSGYVFNCDKIEKITIGGLLIQKMKKIGIPWFFSATVLYVYVSIRKGGSIWGYILNLIGYKSQYWFLTVLFAMYIIFYFIKISRNIVLYNALLLGLTVMTILIRANNLILEDALSVYLNVFYWTVFFSAGFLYREYNLSFFDKFANIHFVVISGGVIWGILLWGAIEEEPFSYFSMTYIPIELIIICWLLLASKMLERVFHSITMLVYLGKMSFGIYLYNELVWAGLCVYLGNKIDIFILIFIRPLIVILMVCFELEIGKHFFNVFDLEKEYCELVGVKYP